MFKLLAFEDARNPNKQIHLPDVVRFFRLNKLLIEPERLQRVLYDRIIGKTNVFDYTMLFKLITKSNKASIVTNPGTQVGGLHPDTRRNLAHKETHNEKTVASLTAPAETHQNNKVHLRNRKRACSSIHLGTISQKMHPHHSKCYHTNHIKDSELQEHMKAYLRDLLVLDQEREAFKIALTNDRDFYPTYCFDKFIKQEGSDSATA